MVDGIKRISDPSRTLFLNAGNLISIDSLLAALEYRTIVKCLGMCNFNLISLGAWDLSLGVARLRQVASESASDIVCANLSGFVPFLRFNKDSGRLKVLVTSVIDPELLAFYKVKGVQLQDPVEALRRLRKTISHDLFIVVLHAKSERWGKILPHLQGVDLVIDGEIAKTGRFVEKKYGQFIVFNNFGGKYLTYVDILKDHSIAPPVVIRLTADKVSEDPAVQAVVRKYRQEREEFVRREKERRLLKRVFNPQARPELFVGGQWCARCHEDIYQSWKATPHARAIESLKRKKRADDPECQKCHVTGMGISKTVGGFYSLETTPQMVGVQCEACHGAGSAHAASPQKAKFKKVGSEVCRSCHNVKRDPEFSYERDWKLIGHGEKPVR